MDTRPFDSWLSVASGAAAAPFGAVGPVAALGLAADTPEKLAAEADAGTGGTLSGTGSVLDRIRATIDDAFFRAADTISDGLCHHFLALQEQGELLKRWSNNYGTIKDGQNAKCGGQP